MRDETLIMETEDETEFVKLWCPTVRNSHDSNSGVSVWDTRYNRKAEKETELSVNLEY